MRIIMCLFAAVLLTAPAFGALTGADLEQIREIVETSNAKTEARLKAYVDARFEAAERATTAEIKALRETTATKIEALRETTATKIEALEKTMTTEMHAVKEEVKTSRRTLYWWIGLSAGALGFLSYQLYTMQRTMGRLLERTDIIVDEWMRRSEELTAQREENAALRAENERLKAQIIPERDAPNQPSSVHGE